jgi:putative membrane protein
MRFHHDHGGGWDAAHWIGAGLMFLILVAILIALGIFLFRTLRHASTAVPSAPSPVNRASEILAERFARGEIDADEFTRRRELLRSDGLDPKT